MNDLYLRSVTEYCERAGNFFYSEPVNTLSNAAFFIAACFTYQLLKKQHIKSFRYWLLFILLILVGSGSLLWHSFRNPFTHALDAMPTFAFFLTYLYLLLEKLTGSKQKAIVLIITFFAIQVFFSSSFPDLLNGSIRHVVNGITFTGLLVWFYHKYGRVNHDMLVAFFLYILAIIFRTIDNTACLYIPLGTHFLWHILTAISAYFAIREVVDLKK